MGAKTRHFPKPSLTIVWRWPVADAGGTSLPRSTEFNGQAIVGLFGIENVSIDSIRAEFPASGVSRVGEAAQVQGPVPPQL